MWQRLAQLSPTALLVAFFALTFPLWTNAYLSPPDSASYLAVPRSLVRDGDLDFANDYSDLEFEPYFFYLTEAGHLSNDWPAGSGIAWMPVYTVAHLVAGTASAMGVTGPAHAAEDPPRTALLPKPNSVKPFEPLLAPTGQAGIYKLLVCLFVGSLSLGALWIGYRLAREHVGAWPAMAAALLVLLGSPVGFYTYAYAMMSHINSMFAVGLLLWGWQVTRGQRTLREWTLLGAVAGVMVMIRPQDGAFLLVFVVEAIAAPRKLTRQWFLGVGAAAAAALLAFSPQVVLWKALYGHALQLPKIEEMRWFAPQLSETLFSAYHGILSWSPMLVLVPFGALLLWRKDRVLAAALLSVVLVQVYLNAANEIWWCGGSFGNRRMVNCGVPFVVLVAAALGGTRLRFSLPVAMLLAAWNFLLWAKERAGELSLDHYVPWNGEFLAGIAQMLNPAKLLVSMMGDGAGFGWPTRLVLVGAGLAVAWAVQRRALTITCLSRWHRPAIAVALAYFLLVAPAVTLFGASRTRSYVEADFNVPLSRHNRSLFNGYYEYGYYNLVRNRREEARRAYQKASDLIPDYPNPHRYLALIALEEGDPVKALEHSGRALDLNPQYDGALQTEAAAIEAIYRANPARRDLLKRLARRLRAAGHEEEAKRIEGM
jgi:hypothetical protein